jgi:hypothetical protein
MRIEQLEILGVLKSLAVKLLAVYPQTIVSDGQILIDGHDVTEDVEGLAYEMLGNPERADELAGQLGDRLELAMAGALGFA